MTRIELASKAWKACVLPLHHTRVFMVGLAGFEPASQRLPVSIFVFYHYYYNPMVEITRIELVSERFHFGFIRSSNPSIPINGHN